MVLTILWLDYPRKRRIVIDKLLDDIGYQEAYLNKLFDDIIAKYGLMISSKQLAESMLSILKKHYSSSLEEVKDNVDSNIFEIDYYNDLFVVLEPEEMADVEKRTVCS